MKVNVSRKVSITLTLDEEASVEVVFALREFLRMYEIENSKQYIQYDSLFYLSNLIEDSLPR